MPRTPIIVAIQSCWGVIAFLDVGSRSVIFKLQNVQTSRRSHSLFDMFFIKETVFLISLAQCSNAFHAAQANSRRASRLLSTISKEHGGELINKTPDNVISDTTSSWQDDVEKLLDPTTSPSTRQQLITSLMQQNSSIRLSAEQALREGKVRHRFLLLAFSTRQ